ISPAYGLAPSLGDALFNRPLHLTPLFGFPACPIIRQNHYGIIKTRRCKLKLYRVGASTEAVRSGRVPLPPGRKRKAPGRRRRWARWSGQKENQGLLFLQSR